MTCDLGIQETKIRDHGQHSVASWVSVVVTPLAKMWDCPFDRMDSSKTDHMKSQCCDFKKTNISEYQR